jgi:septal ring factor EnvC (AmiA/AmiB activator)
VCGVCVHELLHKCGGIVFADVWGDLHICNCVRMQAPTAATAPTVDAGDNAELQEQCKTLQGKLKAANDTIEEQRKVLEAAEKTKQELQAEVKKVETEIKTWKDPYIQRMEELKALKEVCGE